MHKIKKAQAKQIFLPLVPVNSHLVILSFYYIIILKCLKDFNMCKITVVLNVKDYYCKSKLQVNHEKKVKDIDTF